MTLRRPAKFLIAAILAFGTSACANLPAGGPSARDITEPSQAPELPYALVPIDETVVAALARRPSPTLVGRFADHRGPGVQTIGVGDALNITIWEAASGGLFSAPAGTINGGSHSAVLPGQVVAQDGSVTVPYAGRIRVAGRTPPQVEAKITELLTGKAIEPQALVTIEKSTFNTATVTGEVTLGARVPLSPKGDRLLDVIAGAGGVRAPIHESFLVLSRGPQSAKIPMQALLDSPRENIFVRPGDVLTVVREPQTFTAIGASGANAVVPFDAQGITLEQAMAKAGGLLDERADPTGVFVFRYEYVSSLRDMGRPTDGSALDRIPVIYQANLRDASTLFLARRFAIRDKDILVVANAPITDVRKVLSLVQLVVSPTVSGAGVVAH